MSNAPIWCVMEGENEMIAQFFVVLALSYPNIISPPSKNMYIFFITSLPFPLFALPYLYINYPFLSHPSRVLSYFHSLDISIEISCVKLFLISTLNWADKIYCENRSIDL